MDKSLFTTEAFLTGKPQAAWLASMGIKDWSINDGLVDVKGVVNLGEKLGELKRLPVRFGQVSGLFNCRDNQLVSLEGAPEKVGGSFACGGNRIVSLEGGPKKVGGHFDCSENQLVSLEGAPKKVGGSFGCSHNLLVDFKGMEGVSIRGRLLVSHLGNTTKQGNIFVSLDGLPKELYGKVKGLDIQALLALESQYSNIPDIEI